MRSEFQQRLEATEKEIAEVKTGIDSLLKAKENAISTGDDATAVKSKHETKVLEERLEDLTIKKAAIQAKLQTYERNHKAAAKIRDEISATWQQVRPLVDQLIQIQNQQQAVVTEILGKITRLQRQIQDLAVKHIELTDEPFDPPLLRLPREILQNVPLRPLDPWRYLSPEDKKAAHAKREADEEAKQQERMKIATDTAPKCERCERPMTPTGETNESSSGHWTFFCRTHHTVTKKYIKELDSSSRGERVDNERR